MNQNLTSYSSGDRSQSHLEITTNDLSDSEENIINQCYNIAMRAIFNELEKQTFLSAVNSTLITTVKHVPKYEVRAVLNIPSTATMSDASFIENLRNDKLLIIQM